MLFKEFVQKAVDYLKENPQVGELPLYMSQDEEGNGFNSVYTFSPIVGMVDESEVKNYHLEGFQTEDDWMHSDQMYTYEEDTYDWNEVTDGQKPEPPKFEANIIVLYP